MIPQKFSPVSSGITDTRILFYQKTIDKWIIDKNASILVVGGGHNDYLVFYSLGFKNVVISNLDSRVHKADFEPYQWSFQKAEELSYLSNMFDFVVVHAALHHCESPHRALIEMYRVARIGVIAFESRDSLLMTLMERLSLVPSYEHISVYYNEGKFGGVNNTSIPNYIYRWTERDIEKTINAYAPCAKHKILYEYGSDEPASSNLQKKASIKKIVVSMAKPFYYIFIKFFPTQQNLFAFHIRKPNLVIDIHPWIKIDNEELDFNMEWAESEYKSREP
jgi:ubiquinone/menaquinone biosynthesis C-methylase UbiE